MERLTVYERLAGVMVGDLKSGIDERRAFDKLARYEDTGLEPEEINRIMSEYERGIPTKRMIEAMNDPPNAPLTLEELREMSGEPVWVECMEPDMGHVSCWGIRNSCYVDGYKTSYCDSDYGKTWLAYRRKPEEGTKWQQ